LVWEDRTEAWTGSATEPAVVASMMSTVDFPQAKANENLYPIPPPSYSAKNRHIGNS
jgi:hypothetical protein